MKQGLVPALAAPLLFGLAAAVSKPLTARLDILAAAALLYGGAGIGLALLRGLRLRENANEARLAAVDGPWLAASVILGGVAGPMLFLLAVRGGRAVDAALALNLEVPLTALVAWTAFGEPLSLRTLAGVAAVFMGSAVLMGAQAGSAQAPALFAAGACLCWAVDNNVCRRLSARDPAQVAMAKGLFAGALNAGLAVLLGAPKPGGVAVVGALFTGFAGYGLSLWCYLAAMRQLGATRAALCFALAPFIGALTAAALLHEPLTAWTLAAGGCMAAGLWFVFSERHAHEHSHSGAHEHRHRHDEHHRHEHENFSEREHAHWHSHAGLIHSHFHDPDLHHGHH